MKPIKAINETEHALEVIVLSGEETEQSNLVAHAKRELAALGYTGEESEDDPNRWMYEGIMSIVKVFASQGHSGGSAAYAISALKRLLDYKNLSPLTNDPEEWRDVTDNSWLDGHDGKGRWQNIRNGGAFSRDGGKTYTLLSEGDHILHTSEEKK